MNHFQCRKLITFLDGEVFSLKERTELEMKVNYIIKVKQKQGGQWP